MNGRVAKRLRRIAAELHLNPENTYAPFGPLRRHPDRTITRDGKIEVIEGRPIPRPFALGECWRRAYQEAKKLYKGQALAGAGDMPGQAFLREQVTPFHVRHVHSMQAQPETPQ